MPDGAKNEVSLKIAGVIPFLVMKGMAIWDRLKEKDAYDIYFTVLHYPGGIEELARKFECSLTNRLVQEGLGKIRKKFENIDSPGPTWIVNFEEIEDPEERDRIKRDAFERVNGLLDIIAIKPF